MPKPKVGTKWTILIYMAGDNNLSDECIWSIKEMFRTGTSANIKVVIHFDPIGPFTARRYEIPPGFNGHEDNDGIIEEKAIEPTNTKNPGRRRLSPLGKKIFDFVLENLDLGPDQHHMLVFSGHGSAAVGNRLLVDENPPGFLSIPDLAGILEEVGKQKRVDTEEKLLDIIGFDSCVMNTLEIGYELRDAAHYLLASEGSEPGSGWPYQRVLHLFNNEKDLSAENLLQKMIEVHTRYYTDYEPAGVSTSLSACNLDLLDTDSGLVSAVNDLGRLLKSAIIKGMDSDDDPIVNSIIAAHWRAQSYVFEDYVDIWDFCNLLEKGTTHAELREACSQVKAGIEKARGSTGAEGETEAGYVLKSCYSGGAFQHSHGTSLYFPWIEDNVQLRAFRRLRFSKETAWGIESEPI